MNISHVISGIWAALKSPLGLNVVGGLLASLVALVASWLLNTCRRRLHRRRFKQIFGPGGNDRSYTLVYGALALRKTDETHPFMKPGGNPRFSFSISQPVSISELRAANYLASSIGKSMGSTPSLRSDLDVRAALNFDFISFGGPGSNVKTADCQSNEGNHLAVFDPTTNTFVGLSDGQKLVEFEPGFDYAMILKIRPAQFPTRVWLLCAGLDEWGTSGGAWFLANKWNEIRKTAHAKCFAAFVRVRRGQDESAEIIRTLIASK